MIHDQQPRAEWGWRERAACCGMDSELFSPTATAGPAYRDQVAAAKAICAGCSVPAQCLAEALVRIPHGIAGGLTEQERHRLRRNPTTHTETAAPRPSVPANGPRSGRTATQRTGTDAVLLAAWRPSPQVARARGASTPTVQRWATTSAGLTSPNTADSGPGARSTTDSVGGMGEGSHGGHRAPLGSPTPSTPRQAHEQRKDTEIR